MAECAFQDDLIAMRNGDDATGLLLAHLECEPRLNVVEGRLQPCVHRRESRIPDDAMMH
jgi:hypothetical protein